MIDLLDQLVEQYLALESMEATESLLELCGARINEQALPLLKERVLEEEAQIPLWETHGYVRLREKSEQLKSSSNVSSICVPSRHQKFRPNCRHENKLPRPQKT